MEDTADNIIVGNKVDDNLHSKDLSSSTVISNASIHDFDWEIDFSQTKKKKSPKEKLAKAENEKAQSVDGNSFTCFDEGREYDYDELLKLIFNTLFKQKPDGKSKLALHPPQILRIGTKKTAFVNFMETTKTLHRQHEHLLKFLLVELGTNGAMDENQQLIIKGHFEAKQIENVLRRYIKEYVKCRTCGSHKTLLQKNKQLFLLKCEVCGASSSVAGIKAGYQALTERRKRVRAKIN